MTIDVHLNSEVNTASLVCLGSEMNAIQTGICEEENVQ